MELYTHRRGIEVFETPVRVPTPVEATDAASMQFVQDTVNTAQLGDKDRKEAVSHAIEQPIATLSGEQSITYTPLDGSADETVSLTDGMRVLLTAQDTFAANGLYVVRSGAWERPSDALDSTQIGHGTLVLVLDGKFRHHDFVLTADVALVGVSDQYWEDAHTTYRSAYNVHLPLFDKGAIIGAASYPDVDAAMFEIGHHLDVEKARLDTAEADIAYSATIQQGNTNDIAQLQADLATEQGRITALENVNASGKQSVASVVIAAGATHSVALNVVQAILPVYKVYSLVGGVVTSTPDTLEEQLAVNGSGEYTTLNLTNNGGTDVTIQVAIRF